MKRLSLFAAMWLCFLLLIPLVVCADTDTLHEPSGNEIQAEEAVTLACEFIKELTGMELTGLYFVEDGMKVEGQPEMYFGPGWQWGADTQKDCWILILRNQSTIDTPIVVLHGTSGEVLYWEYTDQTINCTYLNSLPTDDHLSLQQAVNIAQSRFMPAMEPPLSANGIRFTGAAFGDSDTWVAQAADTEANLAWKIELLYEDPDRQYGYIGYFDAASGGVLREMIHERTPASGGDGAGIGQGESFIDIGFWNMSIEEKAQFSEKWIPLVNAYLARHPYAPQPNNLFYYATRCVYGIPAKDDIQQEDAIHLARQATVTLGASLDTLERRPVECLFDVTDPQTPLWKMVVGSARVNRTEYVTNQNWARYRVVINAKTGVVEEAWEIQPEMDVILWRF